MNKTALLSQIEFLKSSIIRMHHSVEQANQELEDMNRRLEDAQVELIKLEMREETDNGGEHSDYAHN